ncbi:MAG: hypothetical protein N3B16_13155 [Candidatus Aminicenantes bacterium]|nr:hypothetical protein [Candidatus Aminicenantes bacterium]
MPKFVLRFMLIGLTILVFISFSYQKIVDCIVATIDREIISLLDLKIYEEFILTEEEIKDGVEKVLEKVIEIKLVAREGQKEISLNQEEILQALDDLFHWRGEEKVREKMKSYGLSLDDLEGYLREKLIYKKMINLHSSLQVGVTLKEIENYYHQKYVIESQDKKMEPPPLIKVLVEIENQIRQAKIREQMADWIRGLKDKTSIKVNQSCLKLIEREGL